MDSIQPIMLDKGLDTVTPAPLVEPGVMTDCLNYEITSTIGYRRIDGYERYDGWVNGDIADYCTVNINANDGAALGQLTPGVILKNWSADGNSFIYGTVVGYNIQPFTTNTVTYIPANKDLPLIPAGAQMSVDGNTNLQLTATTTATRGSVTDTGPTFVANLRTYSALLRGFVTDPDTPVAGMLWHRQNLVVALDCYYAQWAANGAGTATIDSGGWVEYGDYRYRVIYETFNGSFSPGQYTVYLARYGASSVNRTQPYNWNRVTGAWEQATLDSPTLINTGSDWASLYYMQTPDTSYSRGLIPLNGTYWVAFTGGKQINGADPAVGNTLYFKHGAGSTYTIARIVTVIKDSGSFSGNNAAGWYEVQTKNSGFNPPLDHIVVGDNIYSDSGLTTIVGTNTFTEFSRAAGTGRLRGHNSRYVGETYNFWGDDNRVEGYMASGAHRALWVRVPNGTLVYSEPSFNDAIPVPSGYSNYVWGSIITQTSTALDKPKYVAIHRGVRLALGFAKGSVLLSVVGEPHNYSGFTGATEVAVGDAVTGLLEAPGSSLIVFGKRGIRRITGTIDSDLGLDTVSGAAGCYDYTAVLVGATPVFVGPNGINTLEQSADYGDFVGQNLSYKISTTLIDEIVPDRANSEFGGVAMALPVRRKSQYRLWMNDGKMICMALTADGPKITYIRYGLTNNVRVPFAWSSQMATNGQEHIHFVWDTVKAQRYIGVTGVQGTVPNGKRVYESDKGWGFDGVTFAHRFDLAHIFPTKGVQTTTVEKVRLYGMSHGLSTMDIKTAGIETDFEQTFHSAVQDISLPANPVNFYPNMHPVTNIVDQANWGMGVKIRIEGTIAEGLTTTEPPHVCQLLNVFVRTEGAIDA